MAITIEPSRHPLNGRVLYVPVQPLYRYLPGNRSGGQVTVLVDAPNAENSTQMNGERKQTVITMSRVQTMIPEWSDTPTVSFFRFPFLHFLRFRLRPLRICRIFMHWKTRILVCQVVGRRRIRFTCRWRCS